MAISQMPALTAHISFLLWELIFGRPGVGRSTPLHQIAIIDSYSENSYLADHMLAGLPPHPSNGDYRFLFWELIFGRPSFGRSTPYQLNGNFTDSCSDSSYFHFYSELILADQVLADLPPPLNSNYRFLLWELIFFRPGVLRERPFTREGNFLVILVTNGAFSVHLLSDVFWLSKNQFSTPSAGIYLVIF